MISVNVQCLACGHTAPTHVQEGEAADPHEHGVFVCGECTARMAYGTLLPRVVVEPFVDERGHLWLRRRYQDPKTKAELYVLDVDPRYAALEAKNILSMVIT